MLCVVIGCALTLGFALPIAFRSRFIYPSLQPIHNLAAGTERVAAGDRATPTAVVQDDDLGELVAGAYDPMQTTSSARRPLSGRVRHLRRPGPGDEATSSRVTTSSPVKT